MKELKKTRTRNDSRFEGKIFSVKFLKIDSLYPDYEPVLFSGELSATIFMSVTNREEIQKTQRCDTDTHVMIKNFMFRFCSFYEFSIALKYFERLTGRV